MKHYELCNFEFSRPSTKGISEIGAGVGRIDWGKNAE